MGGNSLVHSAAGLLVSALLVVAGQSRVFFTNIGFLTRIDLLPPDAVDEPVATGCVWPSWQTAGGPSAMVTIFDDFDFAACVKVVVTIFTLELLGNIFQHASCGYFDVCLTNVKAHSRRV